MLQHVKEVRRVEVRACIAYSETDHEVENIVMDALKTKSLHLARSSVLHESMCVNQCAGQRCGCPGGRIQIDCSHAVVGGNDEVGRTDESTKQVQMLRSCWDKQCIQRDVTEVDVSRRGAEEHV